MRLSPSTAGFYVDQLISRGLLEESGLDQGPMGRPKRALSTVASAGWFAGVEFHAARLQAVRVDFSGRFATPLAETLPASADAPAVVASVASIVQNLAADATGPLLAIGVGAPGVVDPRGGVGREYRYIAQWRDVAIVEALGARFRVPVSLEHNLRAVALAEQSFGGGKDIENFVCLGLRSGFGVGIVSGGRVVSGAHHAAGELGRWPWTGTPAVPVELQENLSAPAIYRRVKGLAADARTPADLREAFASDVPRLFTKDSMDAVWQPVVGELARVIACLNLLLDPSAFFLHGPLTAIGPQFCGALTESARAQIGASSAALRVEPSVLGAEAGALGAASLAMGSWSPSVE